MKQNGELIEVLNDLVRINNDRIEGYEKAIRETDESDLDLLTLFKRMIDQSQELKAELLEEISQQGGEVDRDSTTASGKVYRVWMDVKTALSGDDRKSVLELCEFGEDAAQKAYERALESDATMGADVRLLIKNQKADLKSSHDEVRNARDMQVRVK
jgi:uncharacterized protein (TIGR02284 family)